MLVREVMHPDPITISPEVKLCEAYKMMQEKRIRHLPVMEKDKLVGIITDRDLRLATSKLTIHPFDAEAEVKNVMSRPVKTTNPEDPIEIATQFMRELKIGCLPVVEFGKLVGIITSADLLDAMLMLTGVHKPSGRIDIRLKDKPGELARLATLLAERKINIHSILTYPDKEGKMRLVLRISTMEIKSLAEEICNSDFEILWPPHIVCVK